jgi:nitrite reductase (NO-forming)
MPFKKLHNNYFLLTFCTFLYFVFLTATHAETGEEIFQNKGCVACHTIGKGKLTGPDLKGVTERREEEWLRKWLKSPETMIQDDPIAKEMLKEFFVPMPNQGLTDEEIEQLIEFFEENDKQNDEKK